MACPQCGHDNPNTAKFCNECGALVDRRQGERRQGDRRAPVGRTVAQEGATSRRASLYPSLTPGTENAQGHNAAIRASDPAPRRERSFRGPEVIPVEDARESGAPLRPDPIARIRELEPERISGPSFLGLAGSGQGGSDYLLEEPQRSTWRAWLVLIILVILGGLFYLQWRTNWRAQPHEAPPPPAAPATPSPTAPQGKASPPSDATGVPPTQTPQQANAAPADKQDNKATETKPPEKSAASTTSDDTGKGAKQADDQPDAADDSNPPSDEEAPASSKKAPRQPIAERGSADPTRADPGHDPMLYMAQKYLRGGGPGRNCDQAMVYLRAANEKASAPARSQMGALYATGTCVPLDRVRAYQWFTSALNLDPNNEDLRRERTNLWAQMSSDERQQAVK